MRDEKKRATEMDNPRVENENGNESQMTGCQQLRETKWGLILLGLLALGDGVFHLLAGGIKAGFVGTSSR